MRLRVIRPLPKELEGIPVDHLVFGGAYDIHAPLCDLLLLYGYGVPLDDVAASADVSQHRPTLKARTSRRSRISGRGA